MSKPVAGEVFTQPFLWKRHKNTRRNLRQKTPPGLHGCHRGKRTGKHLAFHRIVTTLSPNAGRISMEVPVSEAKRAGLDTARRCWVILVEYNGDVLERSYVVENQTPLGAFGHKFTADLQRILLDALRVGKVSTVNRQV